MKEDKLGTLSMELSVEILNLVKELRIQKENIISNQIVRSGTSIGANINEANYGQSKADFISLSIGFFRKHPFEKHAFVGAFFI